MENQKKKVFVVTVTNTATYVIKAADEGDAVDLAMDYFSERIPETSTRLANSDGNLIERKKEKRRNPLLFLYLNNKKIYYLTY